MTEADAGAPFQARQVDARLVRIVAIALPMMAAHVTEPLLGIVDSAVIGRLGSVPLLGAVAIGAVVFDLLFWGLGSLRMSTAGLTAQAHGAGDDREVARALARALSLAGALGVLLIALQAPIMAIAFRLMDASPEVTEAARTYIGIRIWAAPFALANYAVLGALIGRARTDLGLLLQVGINLTKIGLTILAVPVLGLGIAGTALATLAAEIVGAAAGLLLVRKIGGFSLGLSRSEVFDWRAMRRMLAVNRDIAIRTVTLLVAFGIFTSKGARSGELTLAANAVLYNLFLVSSYFLDGFATAAEQVCGQAVGARDRTGFHRTVRIVLALSLATGFVITGLALALGGHFIDALTTSPQVREAARSFLPFAAAAPMAGAAAFAFDGIYIGSTWTRAMRDLMLLSFAIYAAVLFSLQGLGNAGLWTAFLAFLAVRALGQAAMYPRLARAAFA